MSKPVYHLGELNQDPAKSATTFGLGFGTEGEAPTLAGTSSFGVSQPLGAILHGEGDYEAAKSSSTWNVNSVVPSTAVVTNIFGEIIPPQADKTRSPLFREHQSLVVYMPPNRPFGGKTYDVYLRYFIYIG
jgi:hypothetical protein